MSAHTEEGQQQRQGLGLPGLAMQTVLHHVPPSAKVRMAKGSRSMRQELLCCSNKLTFKPWVSCRAGVPPAHDFGRQLSKLLGTRTLPLHLTMEFEGGHLTEEHQQVLLANVAAKFRPYSATGEQGTCCVKELELKVLTACCMHDTTLEPCRLLFISSHEGVCNM